MIRNVCSVISIVINSFFRVGGSLSRCDWLAISIRGRSHIVRIRRGVDRGSEKNIGEKFRLLSLNWFRRSRLVRLINRLWAVVLVQIMLFFDIQVRGISMIVGMIYFNIGEGLGFVRSRYRMCLIPSLVAIVLGLLHMLRKLVE